MNERRRADLAAMRLAELSREIEEIESGRNELLKRVDRIRARLLEAGNRTTGIRASVDMLCEHITDVATEMVELRALEEEIKELGRDFADCQYEAAGAAFEAESLQQTLDEAEEDLERLSTILAEGKARQPRGH
ncbi:MAG TPA: hypothetical protein VIG62_23650 [Blastocatellia bacterium]|jgi:chromosome segregation ATPase